MVLHYRMARVAKVIMLIIMAVNLGFSNPLYYSNIRLANKYVFERNYDKAHEAFQAAFAQKTHPFAIDLINDVHLAIYLKKERDVANGLKRLREEKALDSSQLFHLFPLLDVDTKKDFIATYSSLKTKYVNLAFQDAFNTLFEADQFIFRRPGAINLDSVEVLSLRKKQLLVSFQDLLTKFGFPTEEKLGYLDANGKEMNEKILILLRHFIQQKEYVYATNTVDAFRKREILHSQILANLYFLMWEEGQEKDEFLYLSSATDMVGANHYYPLNIAFTPALLKTANTNRINIGLDSFHLFSKYALCSRFVNTIGISHDFEFNLAPYAPVGAYPSVWFESPDMQAFLREKKIDFDKLKKTCSCGK